MGMRSAVFFSSGVLALGRYEKDITRTCSDAYKFIARARPQLLPGANPTVYVASTTRFLRFARSGAPPTDAGELLVSLRPRKDTCDQSEELFPTR